MNPYIEYITKYGPVEVYHRSWEIIKYVRTLVGTVKIESRWLNYRRTNPTVYDPPDIMIYSTYENCMDCVLKVDNGQLILHMTCWQGDSYHGQREQVECEFTVYLHCVPTLLLERIERHAEQVAERQIDREKALKLEKKIKDRAKKLLTV